MIKQFSRYLFLLLLSMSTACSSVSREKKVYNIGLCVVATGRYDSYAAGMIESARKHFCKKHNVTFFVFTDGKIPENPDAVVTFQSRMGWPYDTMKRFHVYREHKDLFHEMDYVYGVDADMLFVSDVGDEILGDRVVTQHPGFVGEIGAFETNPNSTAYVAPHERKMYYCGGFYGGKREEFFRFMDTAIENIGVDLQSDYIAVWHDESHLNRYFINNPPTIVLSPSYCYPEAVFVQRKLRKKKLKYEQKLVALDKIHDEMRK